MEIDKDETVGSLQVTKRTGLTRTQQRYCEEKGHLGPVGRNKNGDRVYTLAQLKLLEAIAELRQMDIGLEESAAVAAERVEGIPGVASDRLESIARRVAREVERSLRGALLVWEVVNRRLETADGTSRPKARASDVASPLGMPARNSPPAKEAMFR